MANRHQARESALEVLYAWDCASFDKSVVVSTLADRIAEPERKAQDIPYLNTIIAGVIDTQDELFESIQAALRGRKLIALGHIERSVLLLAQWELSNRLEIPYRVIINEALQLMRTYADDAARGFVNGVLDTMARTSRTKDFKKFK
ncbi:MAG: transcription antitermination factor NusB [Mariprofundales bacterium]